MTIPSDASERGRPVPTGEVKLATGRHGTAHILQVHGDLDVDGAVRARALIERLMAAHSADVTTIVLDLTGVRVLAAAGLEALLSVHGDGHGPLDLRIVAATQPVLAPLRASDPAGRLRVFPTLDRALDPDRPEPDQLRARLRQQERQLATQPVIERAKGILMHDFRLDADAAFEVLKRLSQDTNTKLHVVAEQIVERHQDSVTGRPAATTRDVADRIRRRER
jgi:anti-anti-sigma factor